MKNNKKKKKYKFCKVCNKNKLLKSFDNRRCYCKKCAYKKYREWLAANPDKYEVYKQRARENYVPTKYVYARKYKGYKPKSKKDKNYFAKYYQEQLKNNPEHKTRVRLSLRLLYRVRTGEIIKPSTCSCCSKENTKVFALWNKDFVKSQIENRSNVTVEQLESNISWVCGVCLAENRKKNKENGDQ